MKPILLAILALVTVSTAAAEVISWDANPASDQVVSYKVYWTTNPAVAKPWPILATVNVPAPLVVTNAAPGRCFYYVTSANIFGESDPSDVAFRPGKGNPPRVK